MEGGTTRGKFVPTESSWLNLNGGVVIDQMDLNMLSIADVHYLVLGVRQKTATG
jgi:hypothetical protein